MDRGSPRELTPEAMPIFREGVYLVLSRWSALQMAVENEWGGRDSHRKADQLASDIISWFTQSREPLYIDDLEDMLDEALLSLNTEAEDGSIEEIAYKLMTMHEECLEGNFQSIEGLREVSRQEVAVNHVRQVDNDDDDDDDSDNDVGGNENSSNMILDAPDSSSNLNLVEVPVVDSGPKVASETDGWVQVSRRRNRGK
ncbi:pre-rRNA-processing protein TSR2 homolog [Juglans microcarpa x Juglans regia]|uniref:pre-rRNA-processing protein TSR2 homolog n=1 Tax=Juglans microcarpa x Juglans regia TaxID=2249226 RepID=UPI001B7E92F8|nr:pre-rRNA-processing protein TSR2 homolog [Juglans microcarpa x Juglans regia]XP_041022291.1 pre-rRNA-processing protein TSR2 homolog [Juglans microcarpa x Juglans regia]XP_041022293.1 pre-rRNA-processing protein TSR2 homolog [Juglans microcarpa x Juglans regia]